MSVAKVGTPTTFQTVATVTYAPFAANDNAAGSTRVVLTDTAGVLGSGLATSVAAVRFHVNPYATTGSTGYTGEVGVIREFDVLGTPTVPEPAAMGMVAVAGAGLLSRRRRPG